MPTLLEIQRAFKQVLTEAARPWSAEEIGVRDQPPIPLERRIRIYHYAYVGRIADSIKEDYASLLKWVDEENFDDLVRAYLDDYPSTYRTIAEVSRNFPEFVESILNPGDPKFLPDLARFEWAYTCASATSPEPRPGTQPLDRLAQIPLEGVRLALNPSLELFTSEWPVDKLSKARPDTVVFREMARLALYHGPHGMVVQRLRAKPFELLLRIAHAETVPELLAWVSESKVPPERLQKWFGYFAERGIIQGFLRQT